MDTHRFSSSYETCPERTCLARPELVEGAEWVPPALPQFSGSKIAEREEKIKIKPQKSPAIVYRPPSRLFKAVARSV